MEGFSREDFDASLVSDDILLSRSETPWTFKGDSKLAGAHSEFANGVGAWGGAAEPESGLGVGMIRVLVEL